MRTFFILNCAVVLAACGGSRAVPADLTVPASCEFVTEEIEGVPTGEEAEVYPAFLPRVTGSFTNEDSDTLSISQPHVVLLVHSKKGAATPCNSYLELVVDLKIRSAQGDVNEEIKGVHLWVTRRGDGLDWDGAVFFHAETSLSEWSGGFEEGWMLTMAPLGFFDHGPGPHEGGISSGDAPPDTSALRDFWFPAK